MKSIYLYNANTSFKEGFVESCEKSSTPLKLINSKKSILHIRNNEPLLVVHMGEAIVVDEGYNYFRMRANDGHVISMIALYCKEKDLPFNDPVNIHHTGTAGKITQMMMMAVNNIPIPETLIFNERSFPDNKDYITQNMSFPAVLKTAGARGQKVWKVKNLEEIETFLSDHEEYSEREWKNMGPANFLLQQYIPNDHDFRVTMYQDEVLGVIKRMSKDGFYNNYSKGADWEVSEITDEEYDICNKARKVVGIDLAGVDFVRHDGKIYFFEVNKSPQINVKYPPQIADNIIQKFLK